VITAAPGQGDTVIDRARAAAERLSGEVESDVWFVARERKYRHPTQKPVQLYARAMVNHTRKGDIVYDPFAGSGTIVLAAEQCDRCARAVELIPTYADVILQRWSELTGETPELLDDGEA
jgi:DNA modification methylase